MQWTDILPDGVGIVGVGGALCGLFPVEIFERVPEVIAGGGGGVLAGLPAREAVVVTLRVFHALGLRDLGMADGAESALCVGQRDADDGAALLAPADLPTGGIREVGDVLAARPGWCDGHATDVGTAGGSNRGDQ